MKIWIDADACPKPVKETVLKASFRTKVPVCLVVNSYLSIPNDPLISLIQVEKGAIAINPRREKYSVENISERLSMRNYMQDLRDGGPVTGGPAPFGVKDKAMFANSFNVILTNMLNKSTSS